MNWENPEYTSYYTDTAGNLHSVAWKNQILYDVSCNPDLNVTSVTKVKLQFPLWGGFCAAPDGNFYVVTGQKDLDVAEGSDHRNCFSNKKYRVYAAFCISQMSKYILNKKERKNGYKKRN